MPFLESGILPVARRGILAITATATSERQEDVYSLAPKVDVMVLIGCKYSWNTRRRYEKAKSLNPNFYHVESAEELKEEWFIDAQRVGITAGASTPDWKAQSLTTKSFIEMPSFWPS